jgi:hypothetical protein
MKKITRPIPLKKFAQVVTFVALMAWVLSACTPFSSLIVQPSTPQAQAARREAQVQRVEIQVLEPNPMWINALVHGNLTESCATLGESQVQYASNTFRITVYAVSPTDRGCVQVTTPFDTLIPLSTNGLPAGTYNVIVNGVSAVFTLPVETPIPSTATATSTAALPSAVPTSSGCIDMAKFVADVTIPDNTLIASNTAFIKTWRLKNTGSCAWDSTYMVSYISGATMTQQPGYYIVPTGQTVAPGQTVDISVGMTSPVENGNYTSSWGLTGRNEQLMPISGSANGNSFYVMIKVGDGSTPPGTITKASIDIELEQGSSAVCSADATYLVHASMTSDGPTTASYEIESTAGQISAGNFTQGYLTPVSPVEYGTVVFDQADTKTFSYRFVGPYPYPNDITVLLRVNKGEWNSVKLNCP